VYALVVYALIFIQPSGTYLCNSKIQVVV